MPVPAKASVPPGLSYEDLGDLIFDKIAGYEAVFSDAMSLLPYFSSHAQNLSNYTDLPLVCANIITSYLQNTLSLNLIYAFKTLIFILDKGQHISQCINFIRSAKDLLDFNITDVNVDGDTLAMVLVPILLDSDAPLSVYINSNFSNFFAQNNSGDNIFSLIFKNRITHQESFAELIDRYNRMKDAGQLTLALTKGPPIESAFTLLPYPPKKDNYCRQRITNLTIVKFLVAMNPGYANGLFEDAFVTEHMDSYHYLRQAMAQKITKALFFSSKKILNAEFINDFLSDNPDKEPQVLLAEAILNRKSRYNYVVDTPYIQTLLVKLFSLECPLDTIDPDVRAQLVGKSFRGTPEVFMQVLQNKAFTDRMFIDALRKNFYCEPARYLAILTSRPKLDNFVATTLVQFLPNSDYWQQRQREGTPIFLQDIVEHIRNFHQKPFLSTFFTRRYSVKERTSGFGVGGDSDNTDDLKAMLCSTAFHKIGLAYVPTIPEEIDNRLNAAVVNPAPPRPSCTEDLVKKFHALNWNAPFTATSRFRTFRPQSLKQYVEAMKNTHHEKYMSICQAEDQAALAHAVGKHRHYCGSFFGKTTGVQLLEQVIAHTSATNTPQQLESQGLRRLLVSQV